MDKVTPVTIVNVGYRSTNYWVVSAGASRLPVDIGWPGTLGTMKANLKKGVPLLVLDVQVDAIPIHCVSLLLDDGSVFTGDLPPEACTFDNPVALATWRLLREKGATRVYPAHGPILHAVINCNFSQSCHCEPLRLRRAAKQSVRLQIRDCFGRFAPSQ